MKQKTLTFTVKNKSNKAPITLSVFGSAGAEVIFAKPEINMKPKIGIIGIRGEYRVFFRIGNQSFYFQELKSKSECKYYVTMLKIAFKNLEKWTKNRK